jgi:hypothetical protein
MKRDNLFWGTALILAGLLLYLQTQGIIRNFFTYLWPLALILVGSWIILNVYWPPTATAGETFSVPLSGARSARLHFAYGMGQVEIGGGAPAGQLLVGSSAVGMSHKSWLDGDRLEVRVDAGPSFLPILGPSAGVWRFQVAQEVPVTLIVETGASSLNVDLRDVLATRLELKTGASSSNIVMPARGTSVLEIESGAASVNVHVPQGTAARIRTVENINSLQVDMNRFPRLGNGMYQSPDFDANGNRTEIHIQSGLGSISVS